MSDYNYVDVSDPAPVASSGSGWIWIIIFIIIIIIIVVILVVVFWRRRENNELDISNVVFTAPNATTIRATWTGVSNVDDQVIMYVYKTGTPINFNSDGTPKIQSDVVARSSPVNGNTTFSTQATVPAGNVTYTAVLIVTNPNISGFNKGATSGGLVPQPVPGNPSGVIHIQANGQSGEVAYTLPTPGSTSPAVATVGYNFSGSTTADNNLFHLDRNGLLCTVMLSQSGFINTFSADTLCTDLGTETYILYDTGTAGSNTITNGPIVITNGVPTINGVRVTSINGQPLVVNNNTVTVNGTPVVFSNGFLTVNGVRVTTINGNNINGTTVTTTNGTTTVVNGVVVPTTTIVNGTTNGTTTGQLGIRRVNPNSTVDPVDPSARWRYDGPTNKWCLINNASRCLTLPSSATSSVNQSIPINVGANGTTWNNINFSLSSS